MVAKEKLDWIKANLKYGDQKLISQWTVVNFNTVVSILRGGMYGKHGQVVIDTAEKIITARIVQQKKESRRFKKKLQQQ